MPTIEVRLPRNVERDLREIANLAGVKVETLIKIALAHEVWSLKYQRNQPSNGSVR